jgi:hypothetical protein
VLELAVSSPPLNLETRSLAGIEAQTWLARKTHQPPRRVAGQERPKLSRVSPNAARRKLAQRLR